jgi:ribosomal protein S27AE
MNAQQPRQQYFFAMDNAIVDEFIQLVGPFGIIVYTILARYADKNGDCALSYKTIANILDIPETEVDLTIKELKAWNLIKMITSKPDGADERIITLLPIAPLHPSEDFYDTPADPHPPKLPQPKKSTNPATIAKEREHNATRRKTHAALKSGRLSKPTMCSQCGKTTPLIEAHHTDYTNPLEVTWLCSPCHYEAHRRKPNRATMTTLRTEG